MPEISIIHKNYQAMQISQCESQCALRPFLSALLSWQPTDTIEKCDKQYDSQCDVAINVSLNVGLNVTLRPTLSEL